MYTLRTSTEDDFTELHRIVSLAFGEDETDEGRAYERALFEFDRGIVALDGDEPVGCAGAYSFEMSLPGGIVAPVAGVTWVGVLPTHRRLGILRSMMDHQLDDIASREESVAVLTASEAVIYGRFGYGLGTFSAGVDIPTRGTALVPETPEGGRVRLVGSDDARKVLPTIEEAAQFTRPGFLRRPDRWWDPYLSDPKDYRDGATARHYAVHYGADGLPDGYASYRVKDTWDRTAVLPGNTVITTELRAAHPGAEAALCRYLLDIDLVNRVQLGRRPLDDPLRFRLADDNRYVIRHVDDWLWVRLVDLPAALSARRYAVEGSVTIAVRDPFRPANDGCYQVDGGPDGACCRRVGATADVDLSLDIDALGSAYLGGVSFSRLAAAGRVTGDPAALRRADALFTWAPLPFCDLPF